MPPIASHSTQPSPLGGTLGSMNSECSVTWLLLGRRRWDSIAMLTENRQRAARVTSRCVSTRSRALTNASALCRVKHIGGLIFRMFWWSPVGCAITPNSRSRSQIAAVSAVAGSHVARSRTNSGPR